MATERAVLFGFVAIGLCLLAANCFGQQTPQGDEGTLVIGRVQVGHVSYGQHSFAILPETQNYLGDTPNLPGRWEFSVEPMFMPDFDEQGSPRIVIHERFKEYSKAVLGGANTDYSVVTRVGLPLILSTEEVIADAAKAVSAHFAELKYTFAPEQITTIPIQKVTVAIPDLIGGPCTIENPEVPVATSQPVIYVWIDCTDTVRGHAPKPIEMKAVQQLRDNLPTTNATLTIVYRVRAAEIGGTNVKLKSVKDTTLYAKLGGAQDQSVLVTRNDLRKLAMTASQEIFADYQGVRSSRCANDFVSDVLAYFKDGVRIESGTFTPEMLKTTYNPADVDPDEVTKTFDKNISSSSSKDNVDIQTSGGVNLLDVFSANGSMGGKTFQERAAASDVEAEWNGKKWIAKSVTVVRANVSQFNASYTASCSDFSVGASQPYSSLPMQLLFQSESWKKKLTASAK